MKAIGRFTKAHALEGELLLEHLLEDYDFSSWPAFMVELQEGSLIPYFIENIRAENNGDLICKLDGINDRDAAKKLVNKNVHPPRNIEVKIPISASLASFIGFTIDFKGPIGQISNVSDETANALFIIQKENEEILIPAHDELIESIDEENKIIYMNLPEGLL